MKLICFILPLFIISANCKLAKQSSNLNYVIAKPETVLHQPPVNLIKYGQFAGYPIQNLPYGPNLEYAKPYAKPVLNYEHQKHYSPALPLPFDHLNHLNFEAKKLSNHHLHHPAAAASELIAPSKFNPIPYLINSNHHLKQQNPFLENAMPYQFDYIPDHLRNYLNPINHLSPSTTVHLDPVNSIHGYNHGYNNNGYNSHSFAALAEFNPYYHHQSSPSFFKYSSPVSTSYFMKINHIVPENKFQAITAKTEMPFYDDLHKLPVHYASANHYGYAPNWNHHNNFVNHHGSIKK